MTKMADNKSERLVRKQTSSISTSAGKVCLNGAGNDEDDGKQDRKCSKETNIFYFDLDWKSVGDHH